MFLVKCPKCNHKMKYSPKGKVTGKSKKCVYCGYNFTIHSNPEKSNIIKKL